MSELSEEFRRRMEEVQARMKRHTWITLIVFVLAFGLILVAAYYLLP